MNPFAVPEFDGGLVLASRSPRRRDILAGLGFTFDVHPPPESVEDGVEADPFEVAEVLALRKCAAIAPLFPDSLVVAADTVVILDQEILSKPRDDVEAARFLDRLAGREHTVVTGVALQRRSRGRVVSGSERTAVTFRALDADAIASYVATGEGRDKAGSYAAQGRGAALVRRIDGCFYNVVGLPVSLLLDLMEDV